MSVYRKLLQSTNQKNAVVSHANLQSETFTALNLNLYKKEENNLRTEYEKALTRNDKLKHETVFYF